MTTHRLTPTPKGCHPGCRVFGDTGVVIDRDTDHERWTLEIPGEPVQFFSLRGEAYGLALAAAYRLSTLDNLHTL